MPEEVPPCDHEYVPPPVAVRLTELPLQIAWSAPANAVGTGKMVAVTDVLPLVQDVIGCTSQS